MKKIFNILAVAAVAVSAASCDLDLYSPTSFNKGNVVIDEETGSQYTKKADMEGLRNSLYNSWMKDIQEMGLEDWLVYSETRADNAYCGTSSTEIMSLEANTQDGANKNIVRDWNWYQTQVSNANNIICNIDRIAQEDPSLTSAERDQWKAEALIWRAFCFFRLTQLWGDAPMVLEIPPAITVDNVEQYYHLYYPDRAPMSEIYTQLVEDLSWACENAPALNPGNKMLLSRTFATGLLARVYAEKPIRDWEKVIQYCTQVENSGLSLEEDYAKLWSYNDDDAYRNSKESVLEIQWTSKASGNWVFMMYHRNAYNPDDSFTWAKWTTPSRDLVEAYQKEGDEIRMNASIVWDKCSWSNYYPSDNYAFMHKMPTNVSSIYIMRLAEIYLLHAEALACTGDLPGAAAYVNRVRARAKLADLPASASASKEAMLDAILKERRLELAFEGFRFFDLARHDKIIEVHNSVNAKDPYWQMRKPLTESRIFLPIPTSALEQNSALTQNAGY